MPPHTPTTSIQQFQQCTVTWSTESAIVHWSKSSWSLNLGLHGKNIFTFDICCKFQYVVCVCMCAGFLGKFTLQCLFFCVPSIMATSGSSSITPSHVVRPKIMEEHISGMWTSILWKGCISIPCKPVFKKSMQYQLLHWGETEGSRGGNEENTSESKRDENNYNTKVN